MKSGEGKVMLPAGVMRNNKPEQPLQDLAESCPKVWGDAEKV